MNAKWDDGNYYAAFISSVHANGKYSVYYVDDGASKHNVDHSDISKPLTAGTSSMNATDYAGKQFHDEGGPSFEQGIFVVKSVAPDNNFLCTRVGDPQDEELFDMSYAILKIREYERK